MVSQELILRIMADHGGPMSTSQIKDVAIGPNLSRNKGSDIYKKLRKMEKYGIVEATGEYQKVRNTVSSIWRLK